MDKKPKFDLSNPGGQPKDWLDKAREPSPLTGGDRAQITLLVVLGLIAAACAAAFFLLR